MSIYKRIYDNLVNSHKDLKEEWKPVGSGLERHHILPRHSGGKNIESNYTYLTPREHTIAHFLLWKINGTIIDKRIAYLRKGYGWSFFGCTHSEETKEKMSKSAMGRKMSEESKKKLSELHRGRIYKEKFSHEHISRMRKKYKFINPQGEVIHIENLLKYCRENELNQAHMHGVWTGKRKQHKGWTSINSV